MSNIAVIPGEPESRRFIRERLELAYLQHIALHIESSDPDDRPLRTYIDTWFAYSRGGRLLDDNMRQRWINTSDIKKRPYLADLVHAVSQEAEDRLQNGMYSGLVKDHTIPVAYLCKNLRKLDTNIETIRAFLKRLYTVSILTKQQHQSLGRKGDMPAGWNSEHLEVDARTRFAHYHPLKICYRLLPAAYEMWSI